MTQIAMAIITKKLESDQLAYLLVKSNKDFGHFTGNYYPAGGHVESGESIEQALCRELKEELDLEIKPIRQISVTPSDLGNQVHWWECQIISGDPTITDSEISDFGYFTQHQLQSLPLWPATKNFFDKFIFNHD